MTKKQKNKHYKLALKFLREGINEEYCIKHTKLTDYKYWYNWSLNSSGICELLAIILKGNLVPYLNSVIHLYDEFCLFEPDLSERPRNSSFWYPSKDREIRKIILEFCIVMTEN